MTYPTPKTLFEIDKFGGWEKVNADFFDPDTGSVAKIEQDLGVSTVK
jgi:sulfate transport system substrate-binding protein